MSNPLFSDFKPVSAKAFKQQIQVDLKGANYNDSVIWHSPEGIDVKPFYHREENSQPLSIPGQPKSWNIGEEIFILDPKISAQAVNSSVTKGTEAVIFKADKKFKIDDLLSNLDTNKIPLYFNLNFFEVSFIKALIDAGKRYEIALHVHTDPVGHLAESGNWYYGLDEDFKALSEIIDHNSNNPFLISINTGLYQNAGASIVQQLAYSLAHVNEYLNIYNSKLHSQTITFQLAAGSNYFFEIAKIRALRLLYASLAKEYNVPENCHVIARPSLRNKVLYDYNTNLLRTTTECMSAVLGGADTVVNLPYDSIYHKTNDFARRISRNQLLILKEESYFEATSNPAEGSYYIESLTEQLAEKALELFKNIENSGGFLKQLKEGTIQKKIKEQAGREQEDFDNKKRILLGTNKHPNPQDRMKDELQLYPFIKMKARKTLIEPIIPKRLAEQIEQERLKKEETQQQS